MHYYIINATTLLLCLQRQYCSLSNYLNAYQSFPVFHVERRKAQIDLLNKTQMNPWIMWSMYKLIGCYRYNTS